MRVDEYRLLDKGGLKIVLVVSMEWLNWLPRGKQDKVSGRLRSCELLLGCFRRRSVVVESPSLSGLAMKSEVDRWMMCLASRHRLLWTSIEDEAMGHTWSLQVGLRL